MRRLSLVVGTSARLRDEALATLLTSWEGPVKRVVEPEDVDRILLDLDSTSLFGDSALWIVRGGEGWLAKHQERLARQFALAEAAGALILVVEAIDGRSALAKQGKEQGAILLAEGPERPEDAIGWLSDRLRQHAQAPQEPGAVAHLLVERLGTDADALLAAVDTAALHAEAEITVDDAAAVTGGLAERPIWEMTGAVADGDARRALELLTAGHGTDPEPAVHALAGEWRRMIAALETSDDREASRWLGLTRPAKLYYPRRRAQALGRQTVLRLIHGLIQTHRQLRTGGNDPELSVITYVLHAQRLAAHTKR